MAFGKNIKTIASIDQTGPYILYKALESRYSKAIRKTEESRTEEDINTISEYLGTKWYCTDPEGSEHHGEIYFRGDKFGGEANLVWNDPI
jgi:hypothetical protein